jgi:hypothetical protein
VPARRFAGLRLAELETAADLIDLAADMLLLEDPGTRNLFTAGDEPFHT